MRLTTLIREARACTTCAADLPGEPRPLLQGSAISRVLIIGQAPGKLADASGVPWDDPSGRRLRDWLGLDDDAFYDANLIALLPMGLCYPGKGKSGDAPPRPECAPQWHERLLAGFKNVGLTIYIGKYAFAEYLADGGFESITEAVGGYKRLLPDRIALPHPSPRNNIWLKKHEWFERDVVPKLRRRVAKLRREAG